MQSTTLRFLHRQLQIQQLQSNQSKLQLNRLPTEDASEQKEGPGELGRVDSIYPGIEDIAPEPAYLQIFVEVASLRVKFLENVKIEMIHINNEEGRVPWLQQVAEYLQLSPEEGMITPNMFFSAIRETEEHLQFD